MSFSAFNEGHRTVPTEPAPNSVLGRILAILDTVKSIGNPTTVAELSHQTGIPKSSTARLIAELIEHRYLIRTDDGISLGMRLFEFGSRASIPKRMIATAAPLLKGLCDLTGDRVTLWVRKQETMVLLAATAGRIDFLPTRPGMRTSVFNTASGKASLAFTDRHVVDRVCERVVPHLASDFKSELKVVRSTSVALDLGDAFPGVRGVASPVLAPGNRAIGAIAVTGPEDKVDPHEIAAPLLHSVNTLADRLMAA